jgi:hypothetical protein
MKKGWIAILVCMKDKIAQKLRGTVLTNGETALTNGETALTNGETALTNG